MSVRKMMRCKCEHFKQQYNNLWNSKKLHMFNYFSFLKYFILVIFENSNNPVEQINIELIAVIVNATQPHNASAKLQICRSPGIGLRINHAIDLFLKNIEALITCGGRHEIPKCELEAILHNKGGNLISHLSKTLKGNNTLILKEVYLNHHILTVF
ncbi:hypothetical protein MKS88_003323 [Plasmodium brasilianum]|uniref:Uncharacterized protein n=1 Tax=Plasmodium brasilianum TaxID=5824 RepID=A0ACB9YA46_PLABR|nr:hypothetical protein MKS88_003323 [Plasmodium brasilianum]